MKSLHRAAAASEDLAQSLSAGGGLAPPVRARVAHVPRLWAEFEEIVGFIVSLLHACEHGDQEGLCSVSQLLQLIIWQLLKCCLPEALLHPGIPLVLKLWNTVKLLPWVGSMMPHVLAQVLVIFSGRLTAYPGVKPSSLHTDIIHWLNPAVPARIGSMRDGRILWHCAVLVRIGSRNTHVVPSHGFIRSCTSAALWIMLFRIRIVWVRTRHRARALRVVIVVNELPNLLLASLIVLVW